MKHCSCYGQQKGMPQDEAMLNNEKIKPIALASIEWWIGLGLILKHFPAYSSYHRVNIELVLGDIYIYIYIYIYFTQFLDTVLMSATLYEKAKE